MNREELFLDELMALEDKKYKLYDMKLIPTLSEDRFIGIRMPCLRSLAKSLYKNRRNECKIYLNSLPHRYIEQDNLHALLIEEIKDFDEAMIEVERFIGYLDNWKTCDIFNHRIYNQNPEEALRRVRKWLKSDHAYTVRYAMGILMKCFLGDRFNPMFFDWIIDFKTEEYYIKLMQAWYFCEAMIHQYDEAIAVIEEKRLEPWTHNKAIQKCIESYRISDERKDYLRSLRA